MRAFEFLTEFSGQPATDTVSTLVNLVKDSDTDPNLKAEILNILKQLEQKANQPTTANTISPPVQEDANSDLISKIESDEEYWQKLMDSDPRLKALSEKKIKQAEAESFNMGSALGSDRAFTALKTDINAAFNKLPQVPTIFKSAIEKECINAVVEGDITKDSLLRFLGECATPNRIIDMPTIVSKSLKSGDLVFSEEYLKLAKRIAKLTPGSSSSASGKGEALLILTGKATEKANPGDITVTDVGLIEVKSSDLTGKSGLSDFVFGGKMQTAKARTILVNTVNKAAGQVMYLDKLSKETEGDDTSKVSGISSIGPKALVKLNPIFQKMGATNTQKMFTEMFTSVIGLGFEKEIQDIVSTIDNNGVVPEKMVAGIKILMFKYYQKINKHAGVLALNINHLTYSYTSTGEDFAKLTDIKTTSLFDFRPVNASITSFKKV
jgi:hypothetical protein